MIKKLFGSKLKITFITILLSLGTSYYEIKKYKKGKLKNNKKNLDPYNSIVDKILKLKNGEYRDYILLKEGIIKDGNYVHEDYPFFEFPLNQNKFINPGV
jgi:hypothetical protein